METPKRRRIAWWKILLPFLGVLGFSVGAVAWRLPLAAERRWGGMKSRVQAFLEKDLARSGERPVLREPVLPGNAWDDYELVFPDATDALRAEQNLFSGFLELGANLGKVEAAIASHEAVLDHLRKGATRSRAKYAYRSESGRYPKPYNEFAPRWMGYLGLSAAEMLAKNGKESESVDLLLDTAQFSRDLASIYPSEISYTWYELLLITLTSLQERILSRGLSREALAGLERSLAILDTSFVEDGSRTDRWIVDNGCQFIADEERGNAANVFTLKLRAQVPRWKLWRYGFSTRVVTAAAFEEIADYGEEVFRAETASWTDCRRIVTEGHLRLGKSANPFVLAVRSPSILVGHAKRESLARIRLLRMAAHFRLTGEILDLSDPFGDRLHHQREAAHLKAWSLGSKGVDEGGAGSFTEFSGTNIVIEVDR